MGKLEDYAVIHPYFLRATGNQLRVSCERPYEMEANPELDVRITSLVYTADQPYATVFPVQDVLQLRTQITAASLPANLTGSFDWRQPIPVWKWTQDAAIADTDVNRNSLKATVESTWQSLQAMAGGDSGVKWLNVVRTTSSDFIRASELRGQSYRALDTLVDVATHLKMPGDEDPEVYFAKAAKRGDRYAGAGMVYDAPSNHPPVKRLADGRLPPRLRLVPLSEFGELRMELMANGRLARMTNRHGASLIHFRSNYYDGNRGAPDSDFFICDIWFRLNEQQQWEVAAVYPETGHTRNMHNVTLDEMIKRLPY
ncbi:hypothetical protein [Undibacterium sp. TC9W]|uniref:hypothetical protein n=1 Tax=Undibacterium sp. TC9W TaxID=3413053 RepID=UPI003BF2759E